MLRRWIKAYQNEEGQAFRGNGKLTGEQLEIRRLREENRRLKMEKDILFLTDNESDKRLNLVHDRRMKPIMNINDLNIFEQLEQFLTGSQAIAFLVAGSKEACYRSIQRTLVKFRYSSLDKRSKGIVVRFLIKLTGYSRQQITRLIKRHCDTGKIERQQRVYQGFERRYTVEDIRLLAALDERHNTPSGPAAKKLCERAHLIFKQTEYRRLEGLSVAHLYHLRKSTPYQRQRYAFEKTRPKTALIGERKNHALMASLGLSGLIRFIRAIRINRKASITSMPLTRSLTSK